MKGFLSYLASIPSYLWYTAGEWIIKKLFPKSFHVWFASEIQMIEGIEDYLEERERQINLQLEEMSREFHAGNSAANWEGQSSDLDGTSPQWNLFESRLREKDKDLETITRAYYELQRTVVAFLNDPTLVGVAGQPLIKKMSDIIREKVESQYSLAWGQGLNIDEAGTTAIEGPVDLSNVPAIAQMNKNYNKKNKKPKKKAYKNRKPAVKANRSKN